MIVILCNNCAQQFSVPDHVGGGNALCPHCGISIAVAPIIMQPLSYPPYPQRPPGGPAACGTLALIFAAVAIASLALCVFPFLIFVAFLAVPLSLAGLVLGIVGMRSRKRARAIVATVLCAMHLGLLALLCWGIHESLS